MTKLMEEKGEVDSNLEHWKVGGDTRVDPVRADSTKLFFPVV